MSDLHNNEDWRALLRAIVEYPHDQLPRLVAADWLDENDDGTNGFASRAEFIRLMCDGLPTAHDLWTKVFPYGNSPYHPRTEDGINVGDSPTWLMSEVYNAEWTHLPRGLVRNGFIEEIRCPLGWWVRDECGRCAGTGIYTDDEMQCVACLGTGRTPANGPSVVSRQPVTRVVCSDLEPYYDRLTETWSWPAELIHETVRRNLSPVLARWVREDGLYFDTREAAVEAMSRALVDLARGQAGLTPIQWTDTSNKESA